MSGNWAAWFASSAGEARHGNWGRADFGEV